MFDSIKSWLKRNFTPITVTVKPVIPTPPKPITSTFGPVVTQPTNRLTIVDVSHHNNDSLGDYIDWAGLVEAGVDGFIVKLTEGATYVDPWATRNIVGALSTGKPVGVYHFFRADVDPEEQAANFLNALKSLGGHAALLELPNTIDSETEDGQSASKIWDGVWKMMQLLPGIEIDYTGEAFFKEHSFPVNDGYIRWIAKYSSNQPSVGGAIAMWQFSESKTFPGVKGQYDCSYFYGTMADLLKMKQG